MIVNAYLGETTYRLKTGRTRRFTPQGDVYRCRDGRLPAAGEKDNPVERIAGSGLSARLFVGLNVGPTPTYTVEDVVNAVWAFRKGGASFLVQKGIYQDASGGRVSEDSVQVVILDFEQTPVDTFTASMTELGVHLREKFHQDSVVVEIQNKGVVSDVYSITA